MVDYRLPNKLTSSFLSLLVPLLALNVTLLSSPVQAAVDPSSRGYKLTQIVSGLWFPKEVFEASSSDLNRQAVHAALNREARMLHENGALTLQLVDIFKEAFDAAEGMIDEEVLSLLTSRLAAAQPLRKAQADALAARGSDETTRKLQTWAVKAENTCNYVLNHAHELPGDIATRIASDRHERSQQGQYVQQLNKFCAPVTDGIITPVAFCATMLMRGSDYGLGYLDRYFIKNRKKASYRLALQLIKACDCEQPTH